MYTHAKASMNFRKPLFLTIGRYITLHYITLHTRIHAYTHNALSIQRPGRPRRERMMINARARIEADPGAKSSERERVIDPDRNETQAYNRSHSLYYSANAHN